MDAAAVHIVSCSVGGTDMLGESSEATGELNVAYEIADDERELV
jgi:hypothetical protein